MREASAFDRGDEGASGFAGRAARQREAAEGEGGFRQFDIGREQLLGSSQLIGERVKVRVTAETVAVWYANRKVDELPRLRGPWQTPGGLPAHHRLASAETQSQGENATAKTGSLLLRPIGIFCRRP